MNCIKENCSRDVYAKSLCQKHYNLQLYHLNKEEPFNKQRKSLSSKKYYEQNKQRVLALQKKRREENPELLKSRVRESMRKHREKLKSLGISIDDQYLFGGNKQLVYKRDNFTCQDCGLTQEQSRERYKEDLVVHHLDGKGYGTKKKKEKNNSPSNLITLCRGCHTKEHNRQRGGKKPRTMEEYIL